MCPCGSGRPLRACCGPFVDGSAAAPTAEALMRSRYSAHVLGAIDYLMATWEEGARRKVDRAAVAEWARSSEWLGLRVLATEDGGAGDERGGVEFQARYRGRDGVERVHHERSRFLRRDGRWYFVDGEAVAAAPARAAARAGRNDPCPCGSGKKYKKCCGG
jgi:SEC-C motif-containing protein